MPNPITNFKDSSGLDLGNKLITKEYLMSVYPQIAGQLITPELWTWGYNPNGQLGNNTVVGTSTPVTTFAGGANWKQVSSLGSHVAAIKTDGTLWTWGDNIFSGRLGDNTQINRSTPVTTFTGGTNWKQVSAGGSHTAAIKTDGTLWVWGANSSGQIGDSTTNARLIPSLTFTGGTNWKQVSAGGSYTAAIKTDGTLWVWGSNFYTSLGTNDTVNRLTPVTTFAGGTNWKQVSCGNNHIAAIKTDGTLWTWGRNAYGGIGDNTTANRSTPVTTFAGGTNWKQVAGGNTVTSAIKTDGTLWTWGSNTLGQLGNNTVTQSLTPITTFAGGTNWKQVACGDQNSTAIKTDGTLWTWGRNSEGQCGDNTVVNRSTPVTSFAGGTNWKQVSMGTNNPVAIKTSDDLLGI